jgi:hypothetical protein
MVLNMGMTTAQISRTPLITTAGELRPGDILVGTFKFTSLELFNLPAPRTIVAVIDTMQFSRTAVSTMYVSIDGTTQETTYAAEQTVLVLR